ncbi:hypothetical protein ACLI09_12710 [Flavobacterium sp. RHBU_24]|uniref:hypothetical protein n=1 Tax=Flavobacterium sp. RHBU_24 TaxID=3391185 RepID=UPI003984C1EC
MKKSFLLILLALAACKNETKETVETVTDTVVIDTTAIRVAEEKAGEDNEPIAPERTTANPDEYVTGHFVSNKDVTAMATLVREREGNPSEDGTAAAYSITFNDPNIPALPAGCCEMILVNEGDLNGDGLDELGYAQAPMNGCVFYYYVYTYKNAKWKQFIEPFVIPTGCDGISRADMEKIVFKEGNVIYFMQTDMNDEDMEKVKTKAKLL